MRILKLCAAIPLLLMSWDAAALNQADTAAAPIQLIVAGSSAARDTFLAVFQPLCQAPSINLYRANPVSGQDFRAYSCTLLNSAPVSLAIRGVNATVYYRSEGGSGWGPGSIAKAQQIKRLVVDGTCTLVASPGFADCAVSGYSLSSDAGLGHLVAATTDLSVADLEPAFYRGENWVASPALGSEPAPGVLESLPRSTVFAQSFAVLVNNTLPTISISKVDLTSIFVGAYPDWSLVQDPATGDPLPSQPVTICRYVPGSGVQAAAAVFSLDQVCNVTADSFVQAPFGPNGNTVIESSTVTGVEACVGTTPGAIGVSVVKAAAPAGSKYVAVSNLPPSKISAARGLYELWFEASMSKRPGLAGNANTLADLIIGRSRAVAGIPASSASAFAVPGIAGNTPVLPVATIGTPVGVATRGGNSCKTPTGQLF